jgi:hypothetical protein
MNWRPCKFILLQENQLLRRPDRKPNFLAMAKYVLNAAGVLAPGHGEAWGGLIDGERVVFKFIQPAPGRVAVAPNSLGTRFGQALFNALKVHAPGKVSQWAGRLAPATDYGFFHPSLILGQMPEGWDHYEARIGIPGEAGGTFPFIQPRWNGERFEGKTLLLTWEQGYGDTVQFSRYARLVKARGGRVILLAQPVLADVLATGAGVDEVVLPGGHPPHFDFHAPLPSLPAIFRTTLETIPAETPYLSVPAHVPNRESITAALAPSAGKMRIGCAWVGNPVHTRNHERSIPPSIFSELAKIQGVDWFAFQHGMGSEVPFPGVTPLSPLLSTFSDTAHSLSRLDLIITVDTSLAHLAGAMGIPVWLLVTHAPDWRWMLDRPDSPWYPTMRIFRQPRPGDWEAVLRQVVQAFATEFHGCNGGAA